MTAMALGKSRRRRYGGRGSIAILATEKFFDQGAQPHVAMMAAKTAALVVVVAPGQAAM